MPPYTNVLLTDSLTTPGVLLEALLETPTVRRSLPETVKPSRRRDLVRSQRPAVRAPLEQAVDLGVVVRRIVVEEHQPPRAGLPGDVHGVVDRAVAPGALGPPLAGPVLRRG